MVVEEKVITSNVIKEKKNPNREISYEELYKHNNVSDCWVSISGKVYDVTSFINKHPGGKLAILTGAGEDASEQFISFHPQSVYAQLPLFQIGVIKNYKNNEIRKDMIKIQKELEDDGKFESSYSTYKKEAVFNFGCLFLAIYLVITNSNNSILRNLLSATLLGLFWHQMAYWGHDCGHNAFFHDRNGNDYYFSLLLNSLLGVSVQWWKYTHNVHHVLTNSIDWDPDIQHLPAFAITKKILNGVYSVFHNKTFGFDKFTKFMLGYQHYMYYPIVGLARINLYIQSLIFCLFNKMKLKPQRLAIEVLTTFGIFWFWLGTLLSYLPSGKMIALYLLVSHAVAGIIHIQITLSHFPMDTYHGQGKHQEEESWVSMQLRTTTDITCPTWMDWFHGGLQFQAIHHLFPRLSKHYLRYTMEKYVKPLCKKHGLTYNTMGFIECNLLTIRILKQVAEDSKKDSNYKPNNYISDVLNARG